MKTYPVYEDVSSATLHELYELIRKALKIDDSTVGEKLYGVREFLDWKKHADQIESALDARGEKVSRIVWK